MGKSIEKFFSEKEKEFITDAIRNAEEQTTGEIRIRIESSTNSTDVFECARKDFEELGMHKTKHRNGVLLYIAINDKQFAIIGDIKIDAIVGQKYWHNLSVTLGEYFSRKQCSGPPSWHSPLAVDLYFRSYHRNAYRFYIRSNRRFRPSILSWTINRAVQYRKS